MPQQRLRLPLARGLAGVSGVVSRRSSVGVRLGQVSAVLRRMVQRREVAVSANPAQGDSVLLENQAAAGDSASRLRGNPPSSGVVQAAPDSLPLRTMLAALQASARRQPTRVAVAVVSGK